VSGLRRELALVVTQKLAELAASRDLAALLERVEGKSDLDSCWSQPACSSDSKQPDNCKTLVKPARGQLQPPHEEMEK
jgi:hypothetical protein